MSVLSVFSDCSLTLARQNLHSDTKEDAHSRSSKSCHLWLLKAKTWLKLYMRALCHMALGSIEPRLLDNLNISQWRQITTLVESSGLPPRTNASIKHPARQARQSSHDYDNAHASYHGDTQLCLLSHQRQRIMLLFLPLHVST